MIITNNLLAANAAHVLGQVKDSKTKSLEKLSSGYRANRSADDAAGLSISEKMRSQIRGLMRAAENTADGINLVHTTDGATDQAGNILQRMRELAVQSLNIAVNTEDDREKMQAEFDELQSELDRINDQTEFNKKPCFNHYADDYHVTNGNLHWPQDQKHTIDSSNNSMTITYQKEPEGPDETVTIQVPNGTYTTQQLIDEIDSVTTSLGLEPEKMSVEYTESGTCNLVLESGYQVKNMSGGLTYLFHDEYAGSEVGSLIGTTIFDPNSSGLRIYSGHNDEMQFTINYMDGRADRTVNIKIDTTPDDCYTREEMIDYLNAKLAGTDVKALEYGENSIMLGSDVAIVTGLRGNMFEIDDPNEPGTIIATSVFYDNTKYGSTYTYPAEFNGGDIVNASDKYHSKLTIDGTNNLLRVRVNDKEGEFKNVTLPNGSYTFGEMINVLNRAFTSAGVDLKASEKDSSTRVTMPNGSQATLVGFKITTKNTTGKGASIEFDTTTKAYQTLFTDREYTSVGKAPTESHSATYLYRSDLLGGRSYTDSDFPITVDSSNQDLTLKLRHRAIGATSSVVDTYTMKLSAGNYASLNDLVTEINHQFSAKGLASEIKADAYGGKIRISALDANKTVGDSYSYRSSTITISGTARTAFFVGSEDVAMENQMVSRSGNPPVVTLPDTLPASINGNNVTYRFYVNGVTRNVTFPNATYTPQAFADRIKEVLTEQDPTITPNTPSYNTTSAISGTTTNRNMSVAATGTETERRSINANVTGSGEQQQGTTTQTDLKPATYTVPEALPSSMDIDGDNDTLRIWVNGDGYSVRLTHGNYDRNTLVQELQTRLDTEITKSGSKMKVSLDSSNHLVFETVVPGKNSSFRFGNESGVGVADASSFLHGLTANKTPAVLSTKNTSRTLSLTSPISIAAGTTMTLNVNGANQTITWDSAQSFSSANAFLTDLNQKLSPLGVTASSTTNGLTFTTQKQGAGASLSFSTTGANSAISNAMFGEMTVNTAPTLRITTALKADSSSVVMENGKNTFSIIVSGTTYTATFTPGQSYTREQIKDTLQNAFSSVADVTMDSTGHLSFTTKAKGSSVTIQRATNAADSSAVAGMFGQRVRENPSVTATVENGKLKLTGQNIASSYTLGMYRKDGSDVLPAEHQSSAINETHSNVREFYVGDYSISCQHQLGNPTVINDSNNKLSFSWSGNGISSSTSITVPNGSYSPGQLKDTLQSLLDAKLGAGELNVSLNSIGGIKITSEPNYNIGNMTSWNGNFYSRIMQGDADMSSTEPVSNQDGRQKVGATYIVGRKDVKNQTTVISPGSNDTFGLEFWKDNQKYEFKFTLDPGSYRSGELVSMLNSKLSAAAESLGLPAGIVKAGVGKFNTGVAGSNDANALDFYLNDAVELSPAKYRIEGLTGTSLFDIFYKTVGNLTPAYTTGTKDLSSGVDIAAGSDTFSVKVDDTTYNYTIPAGHYTQNELIDKLNELIEGTNPAAPIKASISRGAVKFSHEKVGRHTVTGMEGPALGAFFYESDSRYGEDNSLWLQVGANEMQGITFDRYSVSSLALGINSVNVTEKKYADKALERLDIAMSNLMSSRSRFGALENRLEYTYKLDTNSAENLQRSESIIRDTDMAEEMMQVAKNNILEQAGISVLAQARKQPESVLQLLQAR